MFELPATEEKPRLQRKGSFQDKFASLRETFGRKKSLSNSSIIVDAGEHSLPPGSEPGSVIQGSGNGKVQSGAGAPMLPPLLPLQRSVSERTDGDMFNPQHHQDQASIHANLQRKTSQKLVEPSILEGKPATAPITSTSTSGASKLKYAGNPVLLGRSKSALSLKKPSHSASSTTIASNSKGNGVDLRSVKSSAYIGGKPIVEDSASTEALDQVSEMRLNSQNGGTTGGLSGPGSAGAVTSSVDSLGLNSNAPTGPSNPGLNVSKHVKSLPKISTLFRGKKSSSSAASPSSPYTSNPSSAIINSSSSSLQPSHRKGALSAYEISPATVPGLHRDYCLDDFHIVRRVGKGGFATVFLVRLRHSTGRYYALKAIKKQDIVKLRQEKQIMNEKIILRSINHPFVVELYHTFQNPTYLFMTMEFVAGGDLFSYLRKVQRFEEEDAKFYVTEVLIALEYLHSHNIVYRDLKPENILLDTTGHTKLADFGFAKVISNTTNSFCGTPDYIAAEIVANKPYAKGVDWWSLGVLIFELISGKTPFGDDNSEKVYDNIQAGRIKWHPLVRGTARDICKRLLEPDQARRLGALHDGAEIRQHPWFKSIQWRKAEARQTIPPFVPNCEAPEVVERERARRGELKHDEYLEILKSGCLQNGFLVVDPWVDVFKDF